jgi:hypothetical protein
MGGMAIALCAIAASAGLCSALADARMLPMQFELNREGPSDLCGDHCRTWISAIGTITRDTPSAFDAFVRANDLHNATLVFDSSGGSVVASLALGRAIRRAGMTTTVGKTTLLAPNTSGEVRATLSPRADCESMCAFLLLGGKQRYVPPEARVLVHEIWLGDRRDDAAAASYSAEDLVIVQRDIGRLARYTIEMGGAVDLLEISLQIPPWEPMRKLSQSEIRRMGLDTIDAAPDPASQASAAVPAATAKLIRSSTEAERGWGLEENAGSTTLARRHPLTIEGDEIGSFDLAFACGASADAYDVTYSEKRVGGATGRAAAEPLKRVAISIGRKSIPLEIVSSGAQPENPELDSVARGVLPGALVRSLADDGSHSVTVATVTGDNVETAIRIGNTGVALNFPRFAASCGARPARTAVHAELLPVKGTAVPHD